MLIRLFSWVVGYLDSFSIQLVRLPFLTRSTHLVLSFLLGSLSLVGSLDRLGSFLLLGAIWSYGSFIFPGSLVSFDSLPVDGSLFCLDSITFHGSLNVPVSFDYSGSIELCDSLRPIGAISQPDLSGSSRGFDVVGVTLMGNRVRQRWFLIVVGHVHHVMEVGEEQLHGIPLGT